VPPQIDEAREREPVLGAPFLLLRGASPGDPVLPQEIPD
jgi:hypothetical protein